jgi:hypothetical protein
MFNRVAKSIVFAATLVVTSRATYTKVITYLSDSKRRIEEFFFCVDHNGSAVLLGLLCGHRTEADVAVNLSISGGRIREFVQSQIIAVMYVPFPLICEHLEESCAARPGSPEN